MPVWPFARQIWHFCLRKLVFCLTNLAFCLRNLAFCLRNLALCLRKLAFKFVNPKTEPFYLCGLVFLAPFVWLFFLSVLATLGPARCSHISSGLKIFFLLSFPFCPSCECEPTHEKMLSHVTRREIGITRVKKKHFPSHFFSKQNMCEMTCCKKKAIKNKDLRLQLQYVRNDVLQKKIQKYICLQMQTVWLGTRLTNGPLNKFPTKLQKGKEHDNFVGRCQLSVRFDAKMDVRDSHNRGQH